MQIFNKTSLFIFLLFLANLNCSNSKIITKDTNLLKEPKIAKIKIPNGFKPSEPKKISLKNQYFDIFLFSRNFSQGDIIYIECFKKPLVNISKINSKIFNRKIELTKKDWGFRGLLPISPDDKPGLTDLTITYLVDDKLFYETVSVNIFEKKFETVYKAMELGKYSDRKYIQKKENIEFIKRSSALKKEAFASINPDFIDSVISHPRDMNYITSPFYYKRVYKSYIRKGKKKVFKKKSVKLHRGLDLRGKEGAPVYAMASGKIVLANKLFFEGNMIIIDHGKKNFSYYMHLNKTNVKNGDKVKGGQLIGQVGKTGRVTGAHLHVSFVIDGIQVDPLSLLSLPIKY